MVVWINVERTKIKESERCGDLADLPPKKKADKNCISARERTLSSFNRTHKKWLAEGRDKEGRKGSHWLEGSSCDLLPHKSGVAKILEIVAQITNTEMAGWNRSELCEKGAVRESGACSRVLRNWGEETSIELGDGGGIRGRSLLYWPTLNVEEVHNANDRERAKIRVEQDQECIDGQSNGHWNWSERFG